MLLKYFLILLNINLFFNNINKINYKLHTLSYTLKFTKNLTHGSSIITTTFPELSKNIMLLGKWKLLAAPIRMNLEEMGLVGDLQSI